MNYIPTVEDRHIYLYAKYHYVQSKNQADDLRKILSKRNAVSKEYISFYDILTNLSEVASYHIKSSFMIIQLVKDIYMWSGTEFGVNNLESAILQALLIIIANSQVVDIPFKLGEPDPDILPIHLNTTTSDKLLNHYFKEQGII